MNRSRAPWIIEAEGVGFAYPDGMAALTDVTFRVAQGEFMAVVGANGSGKTTLLKVLMRLLKPQSGRVALAGSDIQLLPPTELYSRVGMVFQNPIDQLFAENVEDDVAFGPRNMGLSESEVAARVDDALAAVDALALRDRPIHHLSFGQQKRVCLAGVLAMRPKLLLLDEPTAGLDPAAESQMIDLLLQLNRRDGVTMVLSSHSVDLLPVLADRMYVLAKGKAWKEGSPREVFADPARTAEAGLRLPLVSQLFHEIARHSDLPVDPIPLTVSEACQRILRWLADGAVTADGEGERP